MDKDLRSVQEVRELLAQAKLAQEALAKMDQEQIDRIVEAVAKAGQAHAQELARMAVEETGFGIVEDKVVKNQFASTRVYEAVKPLKTVGLLRKNEEEKTWDYGVPVGVTAGLVPSTNPTSTVIYKTIISLKAGNPIVFSPHPNAAKCIIRAAELMAQAAEGAGAPKGSVSCITIPTMEGTQALMRHKDTKLILATGGGGMVKAAYSSGTPAIGVGAGNGPAYLHKSCDLPAAVKRILDSKTFDNGTICASEQSIVVEADFGPAVRAELERQGGYVLPPEERDKLAGFILRCNGTMNPAIVGRSVAELVRLAKLEGVPAGTRVLLAKEDGVGEGHPFSNEKLGLILAYYVEPDQPAALKRVVEILRYEGAGHTFSIHAKDESVVAAFAREAPASRVLVNTPSSLGGIGATTNLFPALTLGCGAVGGSSSSNNIGPLDLINIKRVGWGVRELEELKGGDRDWNRMCTPKELTWLVQEVLSQLK